jgi:hypothetical protein
VAAKKTARKPAARKGTAKPKRKSDGTFAKGSSGNPAGRKPGTSVRQHLERIAQEAVGADPHGATFAQIFAERVWAEAIHGDPKFAEMLMKRVWPEKLALEHSGRIDSEEIILRARRRAIELRRDGG